MWLKNSLLMITEILVTDDSTTEQTPNREQGSSRWSSPEEDEDCEFVK